MSVVLDKRGVVIYPNGVENKNGTLGKRGGYSSRESTRSRDSARTKKKDVFVKLTHEEREKIADKVEMFARIFFPVMYLVFNLVYWFVYLNNEDAHLVLRKNQVDV